MEQFASTMAMVAALNAPIEIGPGSPLDAPLSRLEPVTLSETPAEAAGEFGNWCTPGTIVMIPDGREGFVSSTDGDICRIIAAGEKYVTLMPYFIVERVYPQPLEPREYR